MLTEVLLEKVLLTSVGHTACIYALAVVQACSANAAGDCGLHSTAFKKRTCQGIGQPSQHKLNAAKVTEGQETKATIVGIGCHPSLGHLGMAELGC